jgi:hypothetical protein
MQRNMYTDDFEKLIRQKADQYKMYPSDQVWKGVYKSLHGRKRWRWAGLAVLLLGIGIYTGNWYFSDKPAARLAKNMQPSISAANDFQQQAPTSAAPLRWITSNGTNNKTNTSANRTATANNTTTIVNNISTQQPFNVHESRSLQQQQPVSNYMADNAITAFSKENSLIIINDRSLTIVDENVTKATAITPLPEPEASGEQAAKTPAEKALTSFADASSEAAVEEKSQGINWLQEYAVYQLAAKKAKRVGLQLHFSPTVNYRKLSGKSYYPVPELKSVPLAPNIVGDVDQFVKHRPALGFELGGSTTYRYSKRVTLKVGLQFNYSRYQIEAYQSMPEIATIALNNQTFINDTVSSYSRIRNFSGYAEHEFSNHYFQLSMPVGLEYKVIGSGRLELHVAGTIQPTYLLNRNSYLITTDFKNYMREPSLVRRWNVNGGVEAYVSYNTGTIRWQVGPQFRYQLLSTYSRKYPIKEQLMEYGIKVGVSKTIR